MTKSATSDAVGAKVDGVDKPSPLAPVMASADRALSKLRLQHDGDHGKNSKNTTITLPFELDPKERAAIHAYVRGKAAWSETVELKGSRLCKVGVRLEPPGSKGDDDDVKHPDAPRERDIELFIAYTNVPFPCACPDLVEYYVDTFDISHNAKQSWALYCEEIQRFDMANEISSTMERMQTAIRSNSEYESLMARKIDGTKCKISSDVYNFSGVGKYFLSIDIRKGNFTMLRRECPSLFQQKISEGGSEGELMDWPSYVGQFTDSKFLAQSKPFREIVFGKLRFCRRAKLLQERLMDQVCERTLSLVEPAVDGDDGGAACMSLVLRQKFGDEIVFEITDPASFEQGIESLQETLVQEFGPILHIRAFTLAGIESKPYFVKTFTHNTDWYAEDGKRILDDVLPFSTRVEIKNVPKKFMLQVLKWYNQEAITEKDLYFRDEGVLCKYCFSIFE